LGGRASDRRKSNLVLAQRNAPLAWLAAERARLLEPPALAVNVSSVRIISRRMICAVNGLRASGLASERASERL